MSLLEVGTRTRVLWSLLLLGVSVAAVASAAASEPSDEIPLLGLDEKGSPVQVMVKSKQYSANLAQALESVNETAVPVLRSKAEKPGWHLRTVIVGLGVTIEAGVTPLLKASATPRFRLAFSNSNDPALP